MIEFNQPKNYEHIHFYQSDFPFGTYIIKGLITLPHWHTHMELIYTKKGSVDVYINGTFYDCKENSLIIIPRNNLHSIIPKDDSTYVAIVIGDELLNELKKDAHLCKILNIYHKIINPVSFYNEQIDEKIIAYIKDIIEEYEKQDANYKVFIKLSLCNFFTTLYRYFPHIFTQQENIQICQTDYIKSSIEYLTKNYDKKITVKNMCDRVFLSEQHFSRLFKSYTGKTLIDYLTLFRLEQAEKLLIETSIPITHIPELVGFCNSNYFSRCYKKQYGHSPSITRKNRT